MLSFLVIVCIQFCAFMINQPPAANTRFQKYAKHSLKFFFHLLVYTFIPKSSKKNPPKLDVNNLFAFFFRIKSK